MRYASSTVKPTNKPIGCINDEQLIFHRFGENGVDKDKVNHKLKELTRLLLSFTLSDLLDLLTKDPEKLQGLLNKIPKSSLYSQKVQENLRTILEILHKVCLKPDVDSVMVNTNRRVREYVPLSKRGGYQALIGLSRDRIAVETPRKSETIENKPRPLRLPKPLVKGEKRSKDHPEYYERWADRENKDETPLEFLERVWGDYIRAGLLYQTDLRGERKKDICQNALDSTLYNELRTSCKKQGKLLPDFLPTKSHEVEKRQVIVESKVSGIGKPIPNSYIYKTRNKILQRKIL